MALRPQHVPLELLNKVTKALGITALDQWYYVPQKAAHKIIGGRALKLFGGTVASFLQSAYPHHSFDEEKLALRRNLEREQKFIEVIIRKLFPNAEIHTKARKAVGIKNPDTEAYLEIDFWIPSLKLGIEYQDRHHYEYQWYANHALQDYQKRDDIKKDTMATMGYTLVAIGYWWDKSIESLAATIRRVRPDLLYEFNKISAEPIPPYPPIEDVASRGIPGVAGLMSAFVPMSNFDPTDWFASEKHDGIRGVYNPEFDKMYSRSGNELSVLSSLLKDIPNMLVEGEITAGRGNYAKTATVSFHALHDKVNWPMFRYVIFDIPNAELGSFSQRYSAIASGILTWPFIFAQSTPPVLLLSKSHLKMLVHSIIFDGGEGVIVQKDTQYEYGRAKGLAKIKVRRDDDAQVLLVNEISCTCKLTSGAKVEITFCNDFDASSLKAGDVVSYYHNGYSQSGTPKNAEIYKIRYDVTWEQLVDTTMAQYVSKRRSAKDVRASKSLSHRIARHKLGYWNKVPNIRAFFDEFARTSGFDPHVAENWYQIKQLALRNAGGSGLLNAYNYKLKNALARAYPELAFENQKFRSLGKTKVTKGHWSNSQNVRAFFDEFARNSGFDPLEPENWRPVKTKALHDAGGGGLLAAYDFNIKKSLSAAYPELQFDKLKSRVTTGHWGEALNARAFFDKFALAAGFDSLVPENWLSVTFRALRNAGGNGLLFAYSHDIKKALATAYPELLFGKFRTYETKGARGHWNKPAKVRTFLDEFARSSGFDPLVTENWYPVRQSAVRNAGGRGLLSYNYNLKKALMRAYPELKFEEEKFITGKTKNKT